MKYDPVYLQQAFCVEIQNRVMKKHNIQLYSVQLSCQQNAELLISSFKLRFQYENEDRVVSDNIELYGPNEEVFDTDTIADKIADRIKRSCDI